MIQAIKNLLGIIPETNYRELIQEGAIILDVRSPNSLTIP